MLPLVKLPDPPPIMSTIYVYMSRACGPWKLELPYWRYLLTFRKNQLPNLNLPKVISTVAIDHFVDLTSGNYSEIFSPNAYFCKALVVRLADYWSAYIHLASPFFTASTTFILIWQPNSYSFPDMVVLVQWEYSTCMQKVDTPRGS